MAFEQRPEGSEGRSHANSWGKDFQTEGIESKGPEPEACWTLRGMVRNPVCSPVLATESGRAGQAGNRSQSL